MKMKVSLVSRFTTKVVVQDSVTGCYEWIERPPNQRGYVCYDVKSTCRGAGFCSPTQPAANGQALPYGIGGGKSWSSTASTRSMTFDMQDAVDFSEKFHKIQSPDG
ncbi:hypothetical protein [Klebsiella oxytoca]|uniref:hypothetical protein n=1 Tax=Klebsiella oxytoca TaxID=571 RepID=UPI001D1855BB|nr:hypothetical protein [Klebsiella oxytoca]